MIAEFSSPSSLDLDILWTDSATIISTEATSLASSSCLIWSLLSLLVFKYKYDKDSSAQQVGGKTNLELPVVFLQQLDCQDISLLMALSSLML